MYDLIIKLIANNNKKWYTLYGDNMARRRITKASKRRLTIFGTISLIAIVFFFASLLYNIYTIYNLTLEKKNLEKEYLLLQEESEELKTDIEKLNDPNYLANYAREHYLYSKNGEYVLQLTQDEDTEEGMKSLTIELQKNYVVLGLSLVMVFIFLYILCKGKKSNKKSKK